MEFVERFLKERSCALVSESEDKEVLLWAHNNGYVILNQAPNGALVFTKEQLERAKMWMEKVDG